MRAVIFDWGGTLTPWRTVEHGAGWRAYTAALFPDDPHRARAAADALIAVEERAWLRVRDEGRSFTLGSVLADAGTAEDETALAAFRAYWEPSTHTDPDVAPLLRGLRERGLRTGVLSSTSWPGAWHEEILRRDGVFESFDGCVWSSDIDWTKPHEAAFRAAMAAVGETDPSRCVYVGDRPYDDVSGAKAVGMRAVFVPHSDLPERQRVPVDVEPDAVIDRLSDLLPIVDRWLGA